MRAFTLTRYFSLASLILLVVAGAVLGILVRQHEIRQIEQLTEDRNVVMTQVFRNLLSGEIQALLHDTDREIRTEQHSSRNLAALQGKIAVLMQDAVIAKLKLYNPHGLTLFSTDARQIGENKSANGGFVTALNGHVVSELTHRDQFSAYEGMKEDIDLVSSYVPILENGRVIAVFELYQDVTSLIQQTNQSVWQVWEIVATVLGSLYLLQFLVVRHAQAALCLQETQLEAANRQLDQRVAERTRALQQSEGRLRATLDSARDAIITVGISGNIVGWNPAAEHMFGYTVSEACGQTLTTIIPERYGHAAMESFSVMMDGDPQGKNGSTAELVGRRKDGSEFMLDRSVALWETSEGRFFTAIIRDITERKQTEAEITVAAAAFESQEGMMVTDAQGVILRVNTAFIETTGYSAEEVIGQTPKILHSGRHDRAFYSAMWETINHTGSWQGEIWDRRKNGEIYPKWLTISAVKGKSGIVTHYVGTHTDITERKIAEEKINQLAFFDQLTGLANRTLLLDRLQQAMLASERSETYGALLFLDLDRFKTLNDTLGHDHGDMLLKQVAQILTSHIRQGDTVARLGGDEFVIALGGFDDNAIEAATSVEVVCQKLLAALKQDYLLGGTEFHSSASIGVTLYMGRETSIDELLKQADLAMYKSKEAGRNAFTFFDPAMAAAVLARTRMETELRRAISEKQFLLHYQAQVDGASARIVGAEALVRWIHPVRGMVSPAEFIPSAEESGLILPLGQWVLEAACRQLADWASQPAMADLTLAVNVSVQQFCQPDFVERVLIVLEESGANPERLKLELTESLFVESVDDIIAKMSALKTTGVGFSLDDFGTGYSSLAYLSQLPLDQLKIDRSFVMNLESNESNVAICAATINLAHSLKLKVVAEGVETDAQRHFLTTVHRCDFLQGYLLSRPLPLEGFERLLKPALI